jgi:DNA-binding response OmpR family regulator
MRILVVEDDRPIAEAIVETLRDERYAVDLAATGEEASEMVAVNDYDLVVLDWSIPPPTGIELLREWRSQGLELPVLMLTGHTDVEDRVGGLDTGADDYLTQPFRFAELLARVRSLLRRRARPLDPPLAVADVVVDRARLEVEVAGEPIELTPKEFALLEYLIRRRGEVVSRTDLAEHVWDGSFDSLSNVIDVTVFRLRQKLDAGRDRKLIHTVKGAGYVLREEEPS